MNQTLRSPLFLVVALLMLAGVFGAYSGHFENPFHFDDDHTIVTNKWVRQLDSFPRYFSDTSTSSSLPANQAYRPGVTLLHAIDYRLGLDTTSKEAKSRLDSAKNPAARQEIIKSMTIPKPFTFHVHIFIGFVLSGFLVFLLMLHILKKARPGSRYNEWFSLFGMGWFWLHTANAETINYISARSDSASTFWILLTFVLYFYSAFVRKYHLYLLTMIAAFFIKEPGIIVAPLLLFYLALFSDEEKPLLKSKNLLTLSLVFGTAVILYLFSRSMTPVHWTSGGTDPFHYLLTQSFVIFHYFYNFILPVNLSADTDWTPVTTIFDDRVFAGVLFIATMIFIAVRCWKFREWRPVSFGIIWFFLALAPTSSVFPFAEVLNDHRTYFPYIGLIIASISTISNLLSAWLGDTNNAASSSRKQTAEIASAPAPAGTRFMILCFAFIIFLGAHAAGTIKRCDVWSSGEKLWGDCVVKSPKNGRAWMHYGMSMLNRGNMARTSGAKDSINYWYDSAEVCYKRSAQLWPMYSYLYVNWGVLRQWQGRNADAEAFYRQALSYNPGNPETYYYLADILRITGKTAEAQAVVAQGLSLSPYHQNLNALANLMQNGTDQTNPFVVLKNALNDVSTKGKSADYKQLSYAYYLTGDYAKSLEAAEKSAALDSMNYEALNNIISADNQLGHYDHAIATGLRMLRINPKYDFGIRNLTESDRCKRLTDSLEKALPKNANADQLMTLSLTYYNLRIYPKCIDAAQRALALQPRYANAWNNICIASTMLKQYDQAIDAGNKALAIEPKHPNAGANLAEAQRQKAGLDLLRKNAGL